MNPDLSDEKTAALLRELDHIIEGDRFPLSPRMQTLTAIRAKLRPEQSPYRRRSITSHRASAEGDRVKGGCSCEMTSHYVWSGLWYETKGPEDFQSK